MPRDNYASSFGFEWTRHAKTQYDSYSGLSISERRFFDETKWPRHLEGELLLEVGSGSGRFTEQAASTGAMVISLDFSGAVDANYDSNGDKENVLIVQGDLYQMPLREGYFDRVFCFGVLQHCPDVEKAFLTLPKFLKAGGSLAVDVYAKKRLSLRGLLGRLVSTRYWVRPFTRRIPPEKLYTLSKAYVEFMWPFALRINRIPGIGRWINWRLLIADYKGVYDLSDDLLREWAILDTFDILSPTFDQPQTIETVQEWFQRAGLKNAEVHYGYNGIEARGSRPGGKLE